jgi:hypothetical protein
LLICLRGVARDQRIAKQPFLFFVAHITTLS